MRKRKYERLTNKERDNVSIGLAQKKTIREIADTIDRSPSTVSREIKRNNIVSGYRAFLASQRAM